MRCTWIFPIEGWTLSSLVRNVQGMGSKPEATDQPVTEPECSQQPLSHSDLNGTRGIQFKGRVPRRRVPRRTWAARPLTWVVAETPVSRQMGSHGWNLELQWSLNLDSWPGSASERSPHQGAAGVGGHSASSEVSSLKCFHRLLILRIIFPMCHFHSNCQSVSFSANHHCACSANNKIKLNTGNFPSSILKPAQTQHRKKHRLVKSWNYRCAYNCTNS